jgi:predicted oxidoreductase (fatty acid repression mutant protein)
VYAIAKESPISDERIVELVKEAVKHSPSAFNSQSSRTVVLLGEQHNKLWDETREILRKIVPAEAFAKTDEKITSFRGGYGTVLVFEDQAVVKGLQENFALYKDNFPIWSLHSSGMLQFVIWTALEAEGLGASLQHYNGLIDGFVAAQWNVPADWKLQSQIVFGKPVAAAGEKQFLPVEDRVKVFS